MINITVVEESVRVIAILDQPNSIEVQVPDSPEIIVQDVGVAGPPGPPAPPGHAYTYQQVAAAGVWIINHNLGYYPIVELLDSGSQEIDGDIVHTSTNQTVITFSPPTAGIALLT